MYIWVNHHSPINIATLILLHIRDVDPTIRHRAAGVAPARPTTPAGGRGSRSRSSTGTSPHGTSGSSLMTLCSHTGPLFTRFHCFLNLCRESSNEGKNNQPPHSNLNPHVVGPSCVSPQGAEGLTDTFVHDPTKTWLAPPSPLRSSVAATQGGSAGAGGLRRAAGGGVSPPGGVRRRAPDPPGRPSEVPPSP